MDAFGSLPGDVLVAILVRLPARSIARCRQVCRAWRSAISHLSFEIAHAERPAADVMVTPSPGPRFSGVTQYRVRVLPRPVPPR
jgi:hypothetical protein